MAHDRHESAKRGQQRKPSGKHPYAAIEHRVIDSPAYADLSFSARAMLIQLCRQLTVPNNNGRLQAAHAYLEDFGFSDKTVTRAIAELVSHGFVFRTRSGGFHQGAAQFAVTWLPLTDNRTDLSCNGFKPFAWRDWTPDQKKTRPPNLRTYNRKFDGLTEAAAVNLSAAPPPKSTDIELMPVHSGYGQWIAGYLDRLSKHGPQFLAASPVALPAGDGTLGHIRKNRQRRAWLSPNLIRQSSTMDRGCMRLEASHAR